MKRIRSIGFLALIFLVMVLPLSAQEVPLRKVGELTFYKQRSQSVAVKGDYVLVGTRKDGVQVTDISDVTYPKVIYAFGKGGILSLEIDGDVGYVAVERSGVDILDVSNPAHPYVTDHIAIPSIVSLTLIGKMVYVSAGVDGVWMIQYADPETPVLISHCPLVYEGDTLAVESVAGSGNSLFVTVGEKLYAFSVERPEAPSYLGIAPVKGPFSDIAYFFPYLYAVVISGNGEVSYLDVFTADNPKSLITRGGCPFIGTAMHIIKDGDYLYISAREGGLKIYSVRDVEAPMLVASVEGGLASTDSKLVGSAIVSANLGSGIALISVANPLQPKRVGDYTGTGAMIHQIDKIGAYLYLNEYYRGLVMLDISNPKQPVEVGRLYTGSTSYGLDILGKFAYVLNTSRGLLTVSLNDPLHPALVGSSPPFMAVFAAYSDAFAYISDGWGGFRVISISDPQVPQEVGRFFRPDTILSLAVTEPYLYEELRNGTLKIVDLSDHANPVTRAEYPFPFRLNRMISRGRYLFTTSQDSGLRVLDIGDPANPQEPLLVSSVYGPGTWNMAVSGDYAALAQDSGIQLIDVSRPFKCRSVGRIKGTYFSVTSDETGIYAAGDDYVHVIDASDAMAVSSESASPAPSTAALLPAYPNPFNSSTNLTIVLDRPGQVNLTISDVTGRVVTELVNSRMGAGRSHVSWDGSGFPTGLYLAVLSVTDGDRTAKSTTKLLLMK